MKYVLGIILLNKA